MHSTPGRAAGEPAAPNALRWAVLAGLCAFALLAAGLAGWNVALAAHQFDGYFANGAFQLLNPLRRIVAGQLPGRDFQVFHGVGAVWAHLPAFLALGGDLRAEEIAKQLMSPVLHLVACAALGWGFRGELPRRSDPALFALLLFAAGPILFFFAFFPGNSLLGVRSAFPLILAATLAATRSPGWIAAALAACLVVSTEQGAASALALGAATLVHFAVRRDPRTVVRLLLGGAGGVVLAAGVLWLASGGHLGALLAYGFRDVLTDQFWYFGAPPNAYLPVNWKHLARPEYVRAALTIAAAVAAALWFWRGRQGFPAVLFLAAYAGVATLSQLAYLSDRNLHGAERAAFAVLLLTALATARSERARWTGLACGLAWLALWTPRSLATYPPPAWPAPSPGYLSLYWSAHLEAVDRLAPQGAVWSVYTGLPEARRGQFNPSFDYLIHAVGPRNRAAYLAAFERTRPALVRLDNYDGAGKNHTGAWIYGGWLMDTNWPFYREVFRTYRLAHVDDWSSLWTPAPRPPPRTVPTTPTIPDGPCRSFVAPAPGIYTAQAAYATRNPLAWVPLVGKTPRFYVERRGDASRSPLVPLPPPDAYGGRVVFPVLAAAPGRIALCPRVESYLPGARLEISDIRVVREPVGADVEAYLLTGPRR